MKFVVFALSIFCLMSAAQAKDGLGVEAGTQLAMVQSRDVMPIKSYQYGMDLDIKKVIAIKGNHKACGVVPMQMLYEDSQGQRHRLEYLVMGTGCTNG